MASGKYLSKQKVALHLDVSTRTIDRLRAAGELDWIPVGGCVRILAVSLEAYEARQRRRLPVDDSELDDIDTLCPIPALDAMHARKAAARAEAAASAGEAA